MLLLLVMLLAVLLLLATILHLLLLARIPARHRVRSRVMRLPVLRMLRLVLLAVVESRHLRRSAPMPTAAALPQIDVDPALVLLGVVLQSQLPAYLLDFGLDLLHVPDAVVSLAHDDVQVPLPRLLRVTDPLLEDFFGFFDELAVQVVCLVRRLWRRGIWIAGRGRGRRRRRRFGRLVGSARRGIGAGIVRGGRRRGGGRIRAPSRWRWSG
jgi:hypothetical protein